MTRSNLPGSSDPGSAHTRVRLLGVSGSLRQDSLNTALLRAAQELAPGHIEVVIHRLDDIPLYDGDVEARGFPDAVSALRAAMTAADGLLVAAPEYNHSVSGVLKNAIDWASRRPDGPLDRKPTALLSAAGGSGGANAQAHLREVLAHNRVQVLDRVLQVPRAWDHVEAGRLQTPEYRQTLTQILDEICDGIRGSETASVA